MHFNASNICNVRTCKKYCKIAIFVIILFIFANYFATSSPKTASAETLQESIENQLNELDLSALENYNTGGTTFLQTVKNILEGKFLDSTNIVNTILNIFLGDIADYLPIFVTILAISIMSSLINGAKPQLLTEGVNQTVNFVCYSTIIVITFSMVTSIINIGIKTVEDITSFTEVLSPILLTLMTASGGTVSVGIYKPAVVLLTTIFSVIIKLVIIPIITLMMVINIISNISNQIKLNKLSDFFASVVKWTLGIFCTIFATFLTVQGISSASIDGVSLKAARYAVSNSIPLIGGFIGGGLDVVVCGANLIKSAVGVGGVIALFYIILSPVIKIVAFNLLLKLASAISEPIGNMQISNYMSGASKCLTYLSVSIILCGFLLLIFIILLIASAGIFV